MAVCSKGYIFYIYLFQCLKTALSRIFASPLPMETPSAPPHLAFAHIHQDITAMLEKFAAAGVSFNIQSIYLICSNTHHISCDFKSRVRDKFL